MKASDALKLSRENNKTKSNTALATSRCLTAIKVAAEAGKYSASLQMQNDTNHPIDEHEVLRTLQAAGYRAAYYNSTFTISWYEDADVIAGRVK